jgi:hypothetical protein
MRFNDWLDTFTAEKGLDAEQTFSVRGPSGENHIPLGCILDAIKSTTPAEQAAIKNTIVKIDFCNGDVCHYFGHLAQAIAI